MTGAEITTVTAGEGAQGGSGGGPGGAAGASKSATAGSCATSTQRLPALPFGVPAETADDRVTLRWSAAPGAAH